MKTQAPCGSWPSPITAEIVAGKTPRLSEPFIQTTPHGPRIFWLETQLHEKGRQAVMMHANGETRCILPYPLNCRSKVHEYGGGSFTVHGDTLYFVLADDQRIYRATISQQSFPLTPFIPEPLTPEPSETLGSLRFGDLTFDEPHNRLLAVCEHHKNSSDDKTHSEPQNSLVAISVTHTNASKNVTTLVSGDDFYAYPRISPCGSYFSWISWNHPHLPWDATNLCVAYTDSKGLPTTIRNVISENENQSIFQPSWSPNGDLVYVSDVKNWWNLYQIKAETLKSERLHTVAITQLSAEFATPLWVLGMSCYSFLNADTLLATYTQNGTWTLAKIHLKATTPEAAIAPIETPLNAISGISAAENSAVFLGANPTSSPSIYHFHSSLEAVNTFPLPIAKAHISHPQSVEFTVDSNAQRRNLDKNKGKHNGKKSEQKSYAFYYPPCHQDLAPNNKPPMIFICHGGPTGATDTALNPKIQYWTNRGFAVMDVNYRGSTGYGRDYRHALHNNWGLTDVDDMVAAADFAIAQGWAAPDKLIIKGSSAGGYTVLAALCRSDRFNAGVSLYGIGDLAALVRDTHKFEARYLDALIGDWQTEQHVYTERSPINAVHQIQCPILVFQGLQDAVVPPNQAQQMVEAVANKGLPVAYVTFEDEGHGFRNPNNIKTMLNAELSFYCQVFDLPHPTDIAPLTIKNLSR